MLLRLIPADTPIAGLDNVHLDISVLLFAVAVTLVVAVMLGLIPALAASSTSLNEALHQAGRSSTLGRGGRRLLRSLTAIEVALAAGPANSRLGRVDLAGRDHFVGRQLRVGKSLFLTVIHARRQPLLPAAMPVH